MYFISSLICARSSKNLFVKIVHPGGHVEIHDRPILVADLLSRHPKCCVAHPHVFRQPYAVVAPSTTLALGHKYYVVPIRTVRRLQLKYSCSQRNDEEEQKRKGKMEKSSCKGEVDCGAERSVARFHHWQPGLESIVEE